MPDIREPDTIAHSQINATILKKTAGIQTSDVKIPNATTQQAIAELEAGKGRKFNSVADMMAALDADD